MRIAVVAAGGRTGRLVVAEVVRRGHDVVAFTGHPDVLDTADRVHVMLGDVTDPAILRRGLQGVDAVVSTMPGGSRADPHLAERTTSVLVAQMQELRVPRLVVTSAYPLVAERPRVLLWLLRRVLHTAYADVARMESVVRASGLTWTIARLNRLTDGVPTGAVEASSRLLEHARPITRADAAAFLVDRATSPEQGFALNVTSH